MSEQWFFVINPVSGKGKGLILWEQVKNRLDDSEVDYTSAVSNFHLHTIQLVTEKYQEGIRNFIGLGGDGTTNEIVNAIFKCQKFKLDSPSTISLIPVGTGNDWVRNQVELNLENLIERVTKKQTKPYDIGLVESESPVIHHYFINVAGTGLDGRVGKELEILNKSNDKGKLSYIKSLIKALLEFESPSSTITIDNKSVFDGSFLVLAASKGQYFGSGMHISPKAVPDNGNLDITVVKKDSNWVIFPQLYKLFNGKISTVPFIDKHSNNHVEISTSFPVPIQADGEYLGESQRIKFSVLKHAILVLA